MNKNKFLKEVNKNIKDISLDESKAIIIEICKDISENNYYKVLYRIKNIENNPNILSDNIKKEEATSIKKFYAYISEKGYVEKEDYKFLCEELKDNMDEILDTLEAFDNGTYYDMF